MPYVKDNRTHYSTEDIEVAVTALVRDIKKKSKGWKYSMKSESEFGIRYWAGPSEGWKSTRAGPAAGEIVQIRYVGDYNKRLSSNVKILKKKAIDERQDDLSLLAVTGEEEIRLPDEVVAQVAAMGVYHLGIRRKGEKVLGHRRGWWRDDGFQKLVKRARGVVQVQGLSIRVMPKLAEPRVRRARTPEERAAYWEKVYTTGRQARKLNWRKRFEVLPALRRYEMAWQQALPQLARAQAAGAEVKPHASPSEFLRALAKQWEDEGSI
jgi:hypothetical protein